MFEMKKYVFFLLLAVLAYLTFEAVKTDYYSWDLSITERIQSVDAGSITSYNERMGVVGVAGVLGVALMAWLWFKGWRAEAFFVGLVGVADLLNPLLRQLIGRPRPAEDIVTVYRPQSDFSFPSGTGMHVLMFCGIIIYLSYRLLKPGLLRNAIAVLLCLYIPVMGAWLIYRGCHWPSDVIGGYIYGAVFLWIIIWGHRRYTTWRRSFPKQGVPDDAIPIKSRPLTWVINLVY